MEEYIKSILENVTKYIKSYALRESVKYNAGKVDEQLKQTYLVMFTDGVYQADVFFNVSVLVDASGNVMKTVIRDENDKEVSVFTDDVIAAYIERKASRDLRRINFSNIYDSKGL